MAVCFKRLCDGALTDITLLLRQGNVCKGAWKRSEKYRTAVCSNRSLSEGVHQVNATCKFRFIPSLVLKFR